MTSLMFPRGDGPLVSFLIPSRDRPEYLKKTIQSIYDTATDKESFEIILKLDEDDIKTQDAVLELMMENKYRRLAYIPSPQGQGFYDFASWANTMASRAKGDWLLLFNDDATIATQGWDQILLRSGTKAPHFGFDSIYLFQFRQKVAPGVTAFPCLRRKTFDILGHFSPIVACDFWVTRVLESLRFVAEIPIEVVHEREPHEGGKTRQAIIDANEFMSWQILNSTRQYVDDLNKLVTWMEQAHAKLEWKDHSQGDGWYWWKVAPVAMEFLTSVRGGQVTLYPYAPDGDIVTSTVSMMPGLWASAR